MPNNYLSVLYKHIIQVENKNVGLKVGGGGSTNIPLPPLPLPTPVIKQIIVQIDIQNKKAKCYRIVIEFVRSRTRWKLKMKKKIFITSGNPDILRN